MYSCIQQRRSEKHSIFRALFLFSKTDGTGDNGVSAMSRSAFFSWKEGTVERKDLEIESYALTREMVAIPSVNGTSGEKDIGVYIEEYLRQIPYFAAHPSEVIVQTLKDDPLERRNVFAILEGKKGGSKKTILLHGHTDTVGAEDYGFYKDLCFTPDKLMEAFKEAPLSEEVREDLLSGEYLFGRGSVDMKSGDAVYLSLAKYLSERRDELDGNLIFAFNPVEENMHTGMIESLDVLHKLRKERGYEYVIALNNDYTCPLYPGDPHHYIYTGAVGKLLPCFYILGKSTHVGQCLEGFDASLIAAKLVDLIHLNTDFCDGYDGEFSLPPSVLKLSDLKDFYNVQTAQEAVVYFNYFVHDEEIDRITKKLVKAAGDALDKVHARIRESAATYYDWSKMPYGEERYEPRVMEYRELYKKANECFEGDLDAYISGRMEEIREKTGDIREQMLYVVKELTKILRPKAPLIVFFYAPPYCPHNTLHKEKQGEKKLIRDMEKILNEVEKEEDLSFKICHFYPSLSDSSYLKIDDPATSQQALVDNFPYMETFYPVPVIKIAALSIPALTIGTYGKDAHKWTERVHKGYTFGVLPKLIEKIIRYYLEA